MPGSAAAVGQPAVAVRDGKIAAAEAHAESIAFGVSLCGRNRNRLKMHASSILACCMDKTVRSGYNIAG